MKLKRLTLGVATCFLLALMTIPGLPKNGRDFAGTYSTSVVSQSGDNYTLTFSAKVFNYSGEDISNATIRLVDSMLPNKTYAVFPGIYFSNHDKTIVSSSVTVPAREYQGWQQGSPPRLVLQFIDVNGNNRLEAVELTMGVAK